MKPTPSKNKIQLFDQVISGEISRIQEIYESDLWTLNVMYCAAAVTVIEIEKILEKKNREDPKKRNQAGKLGYNQGLRQLEGNSHIPMC